MITEESFNKYLIEVGIRSAEYTYSDNELFENIEYFKRCHANNMSAYKALLFLGGYIKGSYKI